VRGDIDRGDEEALKKLAAWARRCLATPKHRDEIGEFRHVLALEGGQKSL